jgi:hypothetical protein
VRGWVGMSDFGESFCFEGHGQKLSFVGLTHFAALGRVCL